MDKSNFIIVNEEKEEEAWKGFKIVYMTIYTGELIFFSILTYKQYLGHRKTMREMGVLGTNNITIIQLPYGFQYVAYTKEK